MSFGGLNFIFDGQYSENYDLKIMSLNGSLTTNSPGGCGIEIFADWVYRNPSACHQGVAQNEPLEFDIELISEDEIPAIMRSKISKWLFGRMDYCKLQIVQRDLQDVYFNCHLVDPQYIYIGNYCHGLTCKVQCDAPWAWQFDKTFKVDNEGKWDNVESYTWQHYNDSDDTDYTYPIVKFKVNESTQRTASQSPIVSIINVDDKNREFAFYDLKNGEEITIDCRNQTIESSTKLLRSENFNKKFFRLVPGINKLQLKGEFSYFEMTYKNARKVGG